jgi:hypothetical protein
MPQTLRRSSSAPFTLRLSAGLGLAPLAFAVASLACDGPAPVEPAPAAAPATTGARLNEQAGRGVRIADQQLCLLTLGSTSAAEIWSLFGPARVDTVDGGAMVFSYEFNDPAEAYGEAVRLLFDAKQLLRRITRNTRQGQAQTITTPTCFAAAPQAAADGGR